MISFFVLTINICQAQDYVQEGNACFDKVDYECAKSNFKAQKLQVSEVGMDEKIEKCDACIDILAVTKFLISDKDYKRAKDKYEELLKLNPKDPYAKKYLEQDAYIDSLASNAFGRGNSGANKNTGTIGSFNLNTRSIENGGLPRPDGNFKEEGRIVISITVNPNGDVIAAELGRGTNIENVSMRKSAIEAAKHAKFNKIQGNNNQTGTITYNFRLQ